MAYNNDNDITKELAFIEKDNHGNYIKVSTITKKDDQSKVSVDIRNYYTTEEGEIRPTQKGVRFNSEILEDVIVALVKAVEDPDGFIAELSDKINNEEVTDTSSDDGPDPFNS